jgi:cytochrome P450
MSIANSPGARAQYVDYALMTLRSWRSCRPLVDSSWEPTARAGAAIAEMLGVAVADRAMFRRWSDAMGEAATAIVSDLVGEAARLAQAIAPIEDYLRLTIAERR